LEAICCFDSVFDTLVEYVRGIAGYLRGRVSFVSYIDDFKEKATEEGQRKSYLVGKGVGRKEFVERPLLGQLGGHIINSAPTNIEEERCWPIIFNCAVGDLILKGSISQCMDNLQGSG